MSSVWTTTLYYINVNILQLTNYIAIIWFIAIAFMYYMRIVVSVLYIPLYFHSVSPIQLCTVLCVLSSLLCIALMRICSIIIACIAISWCVLQSQMCITFYYCIVVLHLLLRIIMTILYSKSCILYCQHNYILHVCVCCCKFHGCIAICLCIICSIVFVNNVLVLLYCIYVSVF